MPETIELADGTTKEVPTEEEINQRIEDAKSEASKEAEDKFSSEKEELEEKIKKAEEKETNFSNLRNKTKEEEEAQKQNKDTIESLRSELDEKGKEIREIALAGPRNQIIKQFAGGNEDLEKAIKTNYNRIKADADESDPDVLKQLVKESYILSMSQIGKAPSSDVMDNISSGGGGSVSGGTVKGADPNSILTPERRDLGHKLGLSDKEMETYAPKINETLEANRKNNFK
jgi:molybdopterin converting factor small subunit